MIKASSGTTIIEAVIAIFIITVGILGGLGLALQATAKAGYSKEETVAANLAREGIEIVRNMRDSNWLNSLSWDQGLSGGAAEKGGILNFSSANNQWTLTHLADPAEALNNETSRLYLKDGFYSTDATGVKTLLKRVIKITSISADEKKIEAVVRIEFKNLTKDMVVEDRLYNWK